MNTPVTPRARPPGTSPRPDESGVAVPGPVPPPGPSPRAGRGKLAAVPTVARHPATRERLHRLRRELAKIDPPPANAQSAWEEIVAALDRAQLGGWTVPPLSDPAATRCADGSHRIALIAHVIVINPWGAFRIDDKLAARTPYFEMPGRDGRGFESPA